MKAFEKYMRKVGWIFFVTLMVLLIRRIPSYGNTGYEGVEHTERMEDVLSGFSTEEIQRLLDSFEETTGVRLSFSEMMRELAKGNLGELILEGLRSICFSFETEMQTNRNLLGQLILMALTGAVFSGFSGIVGTGQVSETSFYVIYLFMMTCLGIGFYSSVQTASDVTNVLMEFMQALLPAYFMAVAATGAALTSASMCGFTIGAIGLMQSVLVELLLPLTRVYLWMVLAGNISRENVLSKMTDLLGHVILWGMKTMFGAILGFHIIQGMILPQADAVKNASVLKLAQAIPGLGGGIGAVSRLVMGSGVLIKHTAGAAAVVVLFVIASVPLLKLGGLMVCYYLTASVMQPVCDKRLVCCMAGAAAGHGLLLKIVGYSLALFVLTIAVLCISTNTVWYAGG